MTQLTIVYEKFFPIPEHFMMDSINWSHWQDWRSPQQCLLYRLAWLQAKNSRNRKQCAV